MLQTWAEDKSARRVLEEWAVRRMQTWYLRTTYERQLRAWEVNQAREQFMLPEHRKARLENQEAMRQEAIALERAQGAAKRAEERRLRREFTGRQSTSSADDEEDSSNGVRSRSRSSSSSSSEGAGAGASGEEARTKRTHKKKKKKKKKAKVANDPPNEYDGLFGSTLRAALDGNLIDPAYISVDDSVRQIPARCTPIVQLSICLNHSDEPHAGRLVTHSLPFALPGSCCGEGGAIDVLRPGGGGQLHHSKPGIHVRSERGWSSLPRTAPVGARGIRCRRKRERRERARNDGA